MGPELQDARSCDERAALHSTASGRVLGRSGLLAHRLVSCHLGGELGDGAAALSCNTPEVRNVSLPALARLPVFGVAALSLS